jgi:glutamine synthetase type III
LTSVKTVTGEDESETSELKYISLIKDIRDNNPDLFEKIKRLPKKARSGKKVGLDTMLDQRGSLVTYFRKGKIQKFFISGPHTEARELDFLAAAETLESQETEKKQKLPEAYFDLLDRNKEVFIDSTTEEMIEIKTRKGRDSAYQILRILKAVFKNTQQLTDDQEEYAKAVMERLEAGGLPKQTTKTALKALNDLGNQIVNPLKVLAVLQTTIPTGLLESHYAEQNPRAQGKREVILSMYLAGE